ncbi:hypothetical protein OUZ56_024423 [Daphnia magna]|uniref:Uncharacterized protein n=1 Tax=Daphnia magna TaxID=35525 RepID=A0ABR0B0T3_9CRUS|nr:hypothetical protein OUZ56_024423 [Daphnia magna]
MPTSEKYAKYSSHVRILPLVVCTLGPWYPRNDEIHSILGINGRSWGAFRFKVRLAAIQRSMDMVCHHFHHGAPNPEAEDIPPLPVETPYPHDLLSLKAVKHPALRVFHKYENIICVEVGLLRLQRLMEKPSSSPPVDQNDIYIQNHQLTAT